MSEEVEVLLDLIEIYANVQKNFEKEKSLDECKKDLKDFYFKVQKSNVKQNIVLKKLYSKIMGNLLDDMRTLEGNDD